MSFCWSTKLVRGEFPCSCSVQSKLSCKNHHHSDMALPFYPVMGVGMACPVTDDSSHFTLSEESRDARRGSDMPYLDCRRCHHTMELPPIVRPARTGPPPRETDHYQSSPITYYSSYSEFRSWTPRASPDFFYDDSSVSSFDSSQESAPPSPIQRESYAPPERPPPVPASYRQRDREAARLPPAGHHAPKKPSPQVRNMRDQHEASAPASRSEPRGLLPIRSQRPQRPRSPVEPARRRRRDSVIPSRVNIPRHPRQHERGLNVDGDVLPDGRIGHFYYRMPLDEAPFKTCACNACQGDLYS